MKPKVMLAFIAGVAATVGLLAALTLSGNLQVAEAQAKRSPTKAVPELDVYYPGTEPLGADEIRVIACGTPIIPTRWISTSVTALREQQSNTVGPIY